MKTNKISSVLAVLGMALLATVPLLQPATAYSSLAGPAPVIISNDDDDDDDDDGDDGDFNGIRFKLFFPNAAAGH